MEQDSQQRLLYIINLSSGLLGSLGLYVFTWLILSLLGVSWTQFEEGVSSLIFGTTAYRGIMLGGIIALGFTLGVYFSFKFLRRYSRFSSEIIDVGVKNFWSFVFLIIPASLGAMIAVYLSVLVCGTRPEVQKCRETGTFWLMIPFILTGAFAGYKLADWVSFAEPMSNLGEQTNGEQSEEGDINQQSQSGQSF